MPLAYSQLVDPIRRREVGRIVGRLNKVLEGRNFILMGPGRWGTMDLNLGIPVTYADIYNARALIELAATGHILAPEPSYGTHFFQDLVEAEIYPLAIYLDDHADFLNRTFLKEARNQLTSLLAQAVEYNECIKVIDVPAECEGRRMEILMDGEKALGYIAQVN
jgi:pyruvate,water dikinase